jgi:c(7)-type cytochrome triheme protein
VKSLRLIFIALAITTICALILPAGKAAALEKADTIYGGEYHPITPPEWYGNVVMKKNIKEGSSVAPVVFKHWSHRRFYTCNVCHTELGFAWKAGKTNVTQADIEAGKKCGVCHNGVDSFGPEKCLRCHSYGKKVPENSKIEFALQDLPPDNFGNKVNWVKALHEKKIKPVASLDGTGKLKKLDKDIIIPSAK